MRRQAYTRPGENTPILFDYIEINLCVLRCPEYTALKNYLVVRVVNIRKYILFECIFRVCGKYYAHLFSPQSAASTDAFSLVIKCEGHLRIAEEYPVPRKQIYLHAVNQIHPTHNVAPVLLLIKKYGFAALPRADNYRGVPLHLNAHLPLVRLGVVDAQPIEAELAPDSQRSVKGEEMLARINGAHLVYAHQPVIARFAAAVIVQRPCDSLVTDNFAQILLEVIFRFFSSLLAA